MIHKYKGMTPTIGEGVFCAEGASIIGQVTLKEEANIWFSAVLRGDVNRIEIGKGTNVQDNSTVHVSSDHATVLGDGVTVGHNCIIHGCRVMDDCLIGMGSTILDGAVIGKESIVGAGSLVTMNKVFPERSLILGSPAKVVRSLREEEIKAIKESSEHYIDYAKTYMGTDL